MKDEPTESTEPKSPLLEKAIEQIITAWDKCEKRFLETLAEKENGKGQIVFDVNIDLSETPPNVITEASFVANDIEGGLKVRKLFKVSVGGQLDDKDQMPLGDITEQSSPSARLFDDQPAEPAEATEAEAKPKRGRKKKAVAQVEVQEPAPEVTTETA